MMALLLFRIPSKAPQYLATTVAVFFTVFIQASPVFKKISCLKMLMPALRIQHLYYNTNQNAFVKNL